MSSNQSTYPLVLTLYSLDLAETSVYPTFILGLTTYMLILLCNLAIVVTICLNRNLHKPMYMLLLNLPVNDAMGATCLFPQLLYGIWSQDRSISFPACMFQGVFVHSYAGASYFILNAMAYDRYVAICSPLRYGAIMTTGKLVKIIVSMWVLDFTLVIVLFCLFINHNICGKELPDLLCYNPPLVKLICEDTKVNNFYGLFILIFYHVFSFGIVAFTYIHILINCINNKHSDVKKKAYQTCGTHLVLFVLLEFSTIFPLLSHRIEGVPSYIRRAISLSVFVFPPIVNPLIYGFKTKEIRQKLLACFKSKKICF